MKNTFEINWDIIGSNNALSSVLCGELPETMITYIKYHLLPFPSKIEILIKIDLKMSAILSWL